nr:immunoglobulin light chain junction region [Macaca mulatta]
CQQVYSNPHSF